MIPHRIINNVALRLQHVRPYSAPEQEGSQNITSPRTFVPVSYATADGGLFVGYYLNIHA